MGSLHNAIYNFWNSNYWDDWSGLIPYVINGRRYVGDIDFYTNHGWEDYKNYDWNPAEEPYDINVTQNYDIDDYFRSIDKPFLGRFPLLQRLLDVKGCWLE